MIFNFNSMVIQPSVLKKYLNSNNLKILDARWYLNDKQRGYKEYKKNHISNAIFFDIEEFSSVHTKLPHMLPTKIHFQTKISKLGIKNSDNLVIYDQIGFFSSCRVWFIFKLFGHKNVVILNGGFETWKKRFLTTSLSSKVRKSSYRVLKKKKMTVNLIDVQNIIKYQNKNFRIIDARPKKRFLGIDKEPRKNVISGKITGSINIPFDSICLNGSFLNDSELNNILYRKNISKKNKIIVLCGSGITACNIIFAFKKLKHQQPVFLYDGSWAEWGMV